MRVTSLLSVSISLRLVSDEWVPSRLSFSAPKETDELREGSDGHREEVRQ